MMAIRADAGRGWGWIVEGWQLFIKAPGVWIVILLIYLAISVVLSLIPLVGMIGHTLLNPVLAGGMLYGAAAQARGEKLEIVHLFQGFRDQERMGPLVMLGLFSVGGYILMFVVFMIFVGGSVATGIALDSTGANVPHEAMGGILAGVGLIVMLIVITIGILITMALFYGVPLVMLRRQNAWPAVQASIAACWINMLPLLVFGLIYIVLAAIAIIPLGFGLLILGPVTAGAIYASYREIFEETPSAGINLAK
ncbi:MAG TPA: hypothetical protein DEP36_04765 [Gammaproteobacteria bacterium]|nr:hypothetical protein [Gammaproteobacteria bacterium]HRF43074.1 BPSS1780 family membrane protein [Candidatus Competibacteraceae bacterium]